MSQFNESGKKTFVAIEAIPRYSAVKLTSTGIGIADLTDRPIGFAADDIASGEYGTVMLMYRTFLCRAQEAWSAGATLYSETDGYLQDTAQSTALPMFIALEAATAQGDLVEVLPLHYGGPAA